MSKGRHKLPTNNWSMHSASHDVEESDPLLAPDRIQRQDDGAKPFVDATETIFRRVVVTSYVLLVLGQFHAGIFNTALKQIVEGVICRNYNDHVADPTDDPRCKAERSQAELSLVFSMETTFELIPGLLLSIPYGVAADIYGRRLVAFISILGCTLYPIADVLICELPLTAVARPRILRSES